MVGVPSYNCAHTIGYVLHQVARGLKKYFPEQKSLILISDGGSQDGTKQVVEAIKLDGVDRLFTTYTGLAGKGSAVRAILETSSALNAQGTAMFDSDLRSITPEWCKIVLEAASNEADLIAPLYIRHKYDGTITNNLCYPFTQAVYGLKVRQPIGGDFGLSASLVTNLLKSPLWKSAYIQRFGVDIFITHTAIARGFTVKEAFLGSKIHEAKDPGAEIAAMFVQVAGSMFTCARDYYEYWRRVSRSEPVPLLEYPFSFPGPEPVKVVPSRLHSGFKETLANKRAILRDVLEQDLFETLSEASSSQRISIPPEVWARTVYSFACACARETDDGRFNELLSSLRGLWLGKVCSFLLETEKMTDEEADRFTEQEAAVFEEQKPFLLSHYFTG
ncbi:glycosyltransferase [Candidatus Bathyarchaeota archaeon]|nr:glycosyltransferase [Candidatus Bathyarchaeota archaeon]